MPTHEGPRTVAEHLAEVLALVSPLPAVTTPIDEALGLVLAEDVTAPEALPRFANSAMDGYAVRAHDVAGASPEHPVVLPVVVDLPAGAESLTAVTPGVAARIMTGAPVPPGADAIVPVERTDAGVRAVTVFAPAAPGAHVRRAGEDVAQGDLVLGAGQELTPYRIAAIAAVGRPAVRAHRRPRVLVMSTGSELVVPGEPLRHGQIPDSNSYLLAAAARAAGASVVRLGAVPDDPDALRAALSSRADVDLVLTSGGVSQGAYDVVKEALIGLPEMRFVPVAMQPGKPQGLGRLDDGTPVLALPGNPVSAFVSFEAFVRPALLALRGLRGAALHRPRLLARAIEGWTSPAGREQHIPVVLTQGEGGLEVRPAAVRGSGSHLVASLAVADGLAIVPREVGAVAVGDDVAVVRIAP